MSWLGLGLFCPKKNATAIRTGTASTKAVLCRFTGNAAERKRAEMNRPTQVERRESTRALRPGRWRHAQVTTAVNRRREDCKSCRCFCIR
jgi:hypothetical protein